MPTRDGKPWLPQVSFWEGQMLDAIPTLIAWALITVLACAGIWDVLRIIFELPEQSVTDAFWKIIYGYPIVSFLCGMLIGHLFWRPTHHG